MNEDANIQECRQEDSPSSHSAGRQQEPEPNTQG